MRPPFGERGKCRGVRLAYFCQAVACKILLRQCHAPVEYFRVSFDTATLEFEFRHAIEYDAGLMRLRRQRCVRKTIARIAKLAITHSILKRPAKIATAVAEMRQHCLDRDPARVSAEEIIDISAVVGEKVA